MRNIIITVLAASLMMSTAFAQDAADPAPLPQDPNTPSVAVESGAPFDLATEAETTAIQIVLLSSLSEDATPRDVTEDADELATLHASIEDNAAVKRQLEASGYAIDDVAAMETNVDGSVIVYVDDRD